MSSLSRRSPGLIPQRPRYGALHKSPTLESSQSTQLNTFNGHKQVIKMMLIIFTTKFFFHIFEFVRLPPANWISEAMEVRAIHGRIDIHLPEKSGNRQRLRRSATCL